MKKLKLLEVIRIKKISYIITLLVTFLVFIIMGVLFQEEGDYSLLFFLPLGYFVINFLGIKTYKYLFKSKVITIIYVGYFIKMVITPFCFALGGYNSFFNSYVFMGSCTKTIIFMCMEYLIIMMFILFSKKINIYFNGEIIEKRKCNSQKLFFYIVGIVFFLIIAYNIIPEIKQIYYFITNINLVNLAKIRWDNETIVARGSFQRYIYSLFMFLWPVVRFILPAVLIYLNYCKRGDCIKGGLISSIYVFIPFLLLGGDNLAPFIASAFALIVIIKLYPKRSKKITKLFIVGGMFTIISIVIGKLNELKGWRGASGITNFAQLLNAYFPGFDNVTIALNMNGTNKMSTFFFDIYSGIPFLGSIFGLNGKTLNHLYVEFAKTGGQIVPWGCNIGYYFTYFLSPFITGIIINKLLKIEKLSENKKEFWQYYIMMIFSTYTSIAIIIYSTQIYLRFIWNIIIPLFIIIKLAKSKIHIK